MSFPHGQPRSINPSIWDVSVQTFKYLDIWLRLWQSLLNKFTWAKKNPHLTLSKPGERSSVPWSEIVLCGIKLSTVNPAITSFSSENWIFIEEAFANPLTLKGTIWTSEQFRSHSTLANLFFYNTLIIRDNYRKILTSPVSTILNQHWFPPGWESFKFQE